MMSWLRHIVITVTCLTLALPSSVFWACCCDAMQMSRGSEVAPCCLVAAEQVGACTNDELPDDCECSLDCCEAIEIPVKIILQVSVELKDTSGSTPSSIDWPSLETSPQITSLYVYGNPPPPSQSLRLARLCSWLH